MSGASTVSGPTNHVLEHRQRTCVPTRFENVDGHSPVAPVCPGLPRLGPCHRCPTDPASSRPSRKVLVDYQTLTCAHSFAVLVGLSRMRAIHRDGPRKIAELTMLRRAQPEVPVLASEKCCVKVSC